MTTTIDGKATAAALIDAVKDANAELEARTGKKTGLAVIIVGDDPASHAYVGAKSRMAKNCGSFLYSTRCLKQRHSGTLPRWCMN